MDEINPRSTRREFFKCWEKEKSRVAFNCSQKSRLLCPLLHIASARYRIREQRIERDKCSPDSSFCFCRRYLYVYVLIVALEIQRLKKIHVICVGAHPHILFFLEYYPTWVECSNLRVKLETQSPGTWPDYQVRFMFTSITKRILILARSNIGFPSDKQHDWVFNNGFEKSWRTLVKTFFYAVKVISNTFINISFKSGIKIAPQPYYIYLRYSIKNFMTIPILNAIKPIRFWTQDPPLVSWRLWKKCNIMKFYNKVNKSTI